MMIKDIQIKNYKGFDDLKIKSLSNINLIGGDNNIGKTSLLEAIFTFHDRLNNDVIIKPLTWRGIPISIRDNTLHEVWLPAFKDFKLENPVEYLFRYDNNELHKVTVNIEKSEQLVIGSEELETLENRSFNSENVSEYSLRVVSEIDKKEVQDNLLYIVRDGNLSTKIQRKEKYSGLKLNLASYISATQKSPSQDVIRFSGIIKDGLEEEVLEALRIIDSRVKSLIPLAINAKDNIIHVDIGIGKKVPIYYLGDGIVSLLEYILTIISTKNGVVLIDEIENGLHYSKHFEIWHFLSEISKKYNVQIFATTHSKEMTEAFVEYAQQSNDSSQASFIELFRNFKTGKIAANNIDIETLNYKLESNKSFRGE